MPHHDWDTRQPAPCRGGVPGQRPVESRLGRAHALATLYYLTRVEQRPWRFSELETELDISPNTLSNRLDEFEEVGLVTRTAYDEMPPRVEYEATKKAQELSPIFEQLYEWAERHWPEANDAFETEREPPEGAD